MKETIQTGNSFDNVSIPFKTPEDMILCMTDKHLPAWISVKVEKTTGNKQNIYAITVVRFHTWLGKAYFAVIFPFHHLLVRYMLKNTIENISK